MIYDSSKDYMTGTVTLVFDGVEPTVDQIYDYCRNNYGSQEGSFVVEPATAHGGYLNPGIVKCNPDPFYFG